MYGIIVPTLRITCFVPQEHSFSLNKSIIDQACSVKIAGDQLVFCVFMDLNSVSVHKHANKKTELAQHPPPWPNKLGQ